MFCCSVKVLNQAPPTSTPTCDYKTARERPFLLLVQAVYTSTGSLSHAAAASILNIKMDTEEKSSLILDGKLRTSRKRHRNIFGCLLVFVLVGIGAGLAVGFGIGYGLKNANEKSFSGTYQHAAVAADAANCSTVGSNILKDGGSAVDAAIASVLCVDVVNLHSTGIGGGGFMVYYNATSKEAYAIDFRETAPMNASTYMFNDTAQNASEYGNDQS